jgi:CHAT domain-containing protein/tetratricopeptide (TPR) repeat protein
MSTALRRAFRQVAPLSMLGLLAAGWTGSAHAQSREQLIDRFRQQCLAKFSHLRGPGQREVVRAHVRPCVQGNMRAHIQGELNAIQKRIETLIDAGKLKEAEAAARSGIARGKQLMREDLPAWPGGYALLGRSLLFQGRLREAEQATREAVTLYAKRQKGGTNPGHQTLLGAILTQQGRHEEADAIFTKTLAALERDPGPSDPQTGRTLQNIAALRLQQGRIDEADSVARRALAIHEADASRGAWISRSLQTIGRAAFAAGRFAEAEDYLKRALATGEAALGPTSWELSHILRFLGQVYFQTGRPAEAEPILRRALEGFESAVGVEHRGTINTMRALGSVKTAMGDPAAAEVILRRALPFAEKVGGTTSADNVSLTYLNMALGDAVRHQGRTQEAEELFKAGLKAAEGIGKDGPYVRHALLGLGRHYMATSRLDDAKPVFQQALALAEKTSESAAVAVGLRWLADLELRGKRPQEAHVILKRLASVLDARRESARVLVGDRFNDDIGPLLRWTAFAFARAAWQLEKDGDSIAGDAFMGAQYESQSTAAAAISQTALRFSTADDALGQLVRTGQDLLQRWQALDEQLTATLQEGATGLEARRTLRTELDTVGKELATVGTRIATEFPQYAALAKPRPLGMAEVQKLLGPEEAILVYLAGERGSFVWAISQDRFTWKQLPHDAKTLGEKVIRLRKGLDVVELQKAAVAGKVELFDLTLAHQLYDELVGPVADVLENKRSLFVVPSGPLTSLPFHLLATEPPAKPIVELEQIAEYANAAWIIKRHAITVLPSVSSLKSLRELTKRPQADKPLIGYGDPAFVPGKPPAADSPAKRPPATRTGRAYASFWKGATVDLESLSKGLEPLPETAEELRGVAQALAASAQDIQLGEAASETTLKKTDLSRYRVVYFATHGLIAGEVSGLSEPALALAIPANPTETDNGLLTASEVAQLKLNADWVVLSACNTAAGGKAGAEAFSGLARAFFYAGARTLLVSHWSVDSAAAVKLTTKAFEALKLDPRMGRAEALRQSMLAYMNDRSAALNAYPAFWAPFALVGEGG